jgi:phosphatidate cytidylyltransferase
VHGTSLVLAVVVLVVANDVVSYAIGRWRGRHVMAPSLSPSKTWEGLIAGTLATFVAAAVVTATMDPPFDRGRTLIAAVVVAFAAPAGDLVASMLKRDAGAENAGKILPGHGGVLDRIDGILLAAPLFFYAWRAVAR